MSVKVPLTISNNQGVHWIPAVMRLYENQTGQRLHSYVLMQKIVDDFNGKIFEDPDRGVWALFENEDDATMFILKYL